MPMPATTSDTQRHSQGVVLMDPFLVAPVLSNIHKRAKGAEVNKFHHTDKLVCEVNDE